MNMIEHDDLESLTSVEPRTVCFLQIQGQFVVNPGRYCMVALHPTNHNLSTRGTAIFSKWEYQQSLMSDHIWDRE